MIKSTLLAEILQERYGLAKNDARRFVRLMFETIGDGLQSDRLVKVKGLGTFKLTKVSSRESVDVNSGERIVIEGRDKITFTPETALQSIINAPFAEFETVMLNDGVSFEEESAKPIPPQMPAASKNQELQETHREEESASINEQASEMEEPREAVQTDEEEESSRPPRRLLYILIGACACMLLMILAGTFYFNSRLHGAGNRIEHLEAMLHEKEAKNNAKPTKPAVTSMGQPPSSEDTTRAAKTEIKTAATPDKPAGGQSPDKPSETPRQYEEQIATADDPRVRTGAYRITGTQTTVTVKEGQTIASISKHFFGPGMECYVEAYNGGIKSVTTGQTLKIPQLKLKKTH